MVDATLTVAPSSTTNAEGERDPEMKQSKKGNQWSFGMKGHIGVVAESGLVRTVRATAGSVNDVTEANALLHGEEAEAFGDAGYQGALERPDAKLVVNWNIAMRPGKRRVLDKSQEINRLIDGLEKLKARIRAMVEHSFRVIKRQFGYVKVRYPGLAKNTAQRLRCLRCPARGWRAANWVGRRDEWACSPPDWQTACPETRHSTTRNGVNGFTILRQTASTTPEGALCRPSPNTIYSSAPCINRRVSRPKVDVLHFRF